MDNYKTIRKQIRFMPDTPSYALIDINPSNDSFDAQYAGLVIDESHGGCCLVILSKSAIKINDIVKIKILDFPIMLSEVRWVRQLDETVLKIGFKYQD